jgi:hypothetical protein
MNSATSVRSYAPSEKSDRLAQLMQEAHLAKKDRDDAQYRLQQVSTHS